MSFAAKAPAPAAAKKAAAAHAPAPAAAKKAAAATAHCARPSGGKEARCHAVFHRQGTRTRAGKGACSRCV